MNARMNIEGTLPVCRPMNKGQIKEHFQISYKTLKKWLEPIADNISYEKRRVFFAPELRLIRELLEGVPCEF